jgi:hypothetical protein
MTKLLHLAETLALNGLVRRSSSIRLSTIKQHSSIGAWFPVAHKERWKPLKLDSYIVGVFLQTLAAGFFSPRFLIFGSGVFHGGVFHGGVFHGKKIAHSKRSTFSKHHCVGSQTDRLGALNTIASVVVARTAPVTSYAAAKDIISLRSG